MIGSYFPKILKFFFLIYVGFASTIAFGQIDRITANAALAEKIYLQLDGTVYTNDQTVYFKSILTAAGNRAPSPLSKVLHVELINSGRNVVEKKLIKLNEGIGEGYFQLNETYPRGKYQLRAYTEWNKNFGDDFIYTTYIDVYPSSENLNIQPISNITQIQNSAGKYLLTAKLTPSPLDEVMVNKINVKVYSEEKTENITVRKNKNNEYLLTYPLLLDSNYLVLEMETEHMGKYSKLVALDKHLVDLHFFPESGHLVHGLVNRIAFKATDYAGKGKALEGKILDENGNLVTTFKSNHLGLGSFMMLADSSKVYTAHFDDSLANRKEFRLPKTSSSSLLLSLAQKDAEFMLKIQTNIPSEDSVFIEASSRGVGYFEIGGKLNKGNLLIPVSSSALPEGVISFKLMDTNRQLISERIYFNERPDQRLDIKIHNPKQLYKPRELTTLDIEVLDRKENHISYNLSVLVLNKDQAGKLLHSRPNILSQILLNSNLRGNIEEPHYYFNENNPSRKTDLDNLLLTLGPEKYVFDSPLQDLMTFSPEKSLRLSGSVKDFITGREKKGIDLTVMIFGETQGIYSQKTDENGRFEFHLDEEDEQAERIVVQTSSKTGKRRDYSITMEEMPRPEINFDFFQTIDIPDKATQELVTKHQERKAVKDAFRLSDDYMELDEFVVEDYVLHPDREKVMKTYGKPDKVIDGEEIQSKTYKWDYGLYSVLNHGFGRDFIIRNDFLALNGGALSKLLTLVLVDGVPVHILDYHLIPVIPPQEVRSVEVIKFVPNFASLYMEVMTDSFNPPTRGNILAIYTKAGKGIHAAYQAQGITTASVKGFSAPKKFPAPNHQDPSPSLAPDLRSLIHWEPSITLSEENRTTVSFYNADNGGEMVVVVEAISKDGRIGYRQLDYKVEAKPLPFNIKQLSDGEK